MSQNPLDRLPRMIRLDDKGALLCLRGVLFVLLTFYVIYSPAQSESLTLEPLAVVVLQLLSIIALLFVRPEWFQRGLFLGGIFLLVSRACPVPGGRFPTRWRGAGPPRG